MSATESELWLANARRARINYLETLTPENYQTHHRVLMDLYDACRLRHVPEVQAEAERLFSLVNETYRLCQDGFSFTGVFKIDSTLTVAIPPLDITMENSLEVYRAVRVLIDHSIFPVIQMRRVKFIDSTGVGILMKLSMKLQEATSERLWLSGPSRAISRLKGILGQAFTELPDLNTAWDKRQESTP